MAECNNQAVENVKSNIASQIATIQNEINDMQQTISRLKNCNGTEENPHNHSSEIGSLNAQISANQALIEKLRSLLEAVTEAKETMEEADRRLRELVEEYQQGKTKRMTLTSAMLSDEMKILNEEYNAGMISPYEYEGTLAHLKEQYIETLQFEIEMKKERLPNVSGNSSEYTRLQEEIKKNTETLISFVELNNMTYPKSLDEQKADELRKEISDLEDILFTAEGSGKIRTRNKLDEIKSKLADIEEDIMNDMVYVWEISKETDSLKVCNQIFERLTPLAVTYGTKEIVNNCIDYKLNDVEGNTREEKLHNYFTEHKLTLAEEYLCRTNPDDLDKGRINLHWITEKDLFNKPMPQWWLDGIEIPEHLVVDENNYNELKKSSDKNALFEFYKGTYMIADFVSASLEENGLYRLDVDDVSPDIMFDEWFDLNYGHLDPDGTDKRRQKYLLEKLDLGVYKEKHGIYTVYTDDITSEFENATLLYLNMYEHYEEYYTGLLSVLDEKETWIPYVGIFNVMEHLSKSIDVDKQITNWLNEDIKNKKPILYKDRELVDGIISGKYIQVDETLLALNDEYVEAVIDENGKVVIKNWVYGEKYGYGGLCRNYNFNIGITDFANQRYVQADKFMLELDKYIDYKISNNIYTDQDNGFKADHLEDQFLKECPEEYRQIRERLKNKAEELRLKGIPDEENAALKELERQTNTLRNYLLGIEDRKALQQFSRVRDVDVAVEIGKGIIDAGALAAGLLLTGPAGVIAGLGIETLAIGLCVEHGDDEEAIARTVGVIAGVGLGAVSKYADDVADLTDDTFGSVYKKKIASESSEYVDDITKYADEVVDIADDKITSFADLMTPEEAARYNEYWDNLGNLKSTTIADDFVDDIKPLEKTKPDVVDDIIDKADDVAESGVTKPNQVHHYATNKNKIYTQEFKDITDKYGLDLDADWNKELLPHQGRHPNAYHDFILDEMKNIDNIANGDKEIFLELYESEIKSVIRDNPDMLYSNYWKGLSE